MSAVPLSVVMPVYNERDVVRLSVTDVRRHVLDLVPGAEFVVVNDGSTDDSGRVLDELAATDDRIRVVHQRNRGHGGALMTGLSSARGDWVFLIDSDGQISLESFPEAWTLAQEGHEGVFGVRRRRHDPMLRLWLSRVVRWTVRAFFGATISDANVPYKLLKRSIWNEALAYIPEHTLTPSLFLAVFARRRGYDIVEIDVHHRERTTGETSIRRLRLLRFCARAFRQLVEFRRDISHV